VKLFFYILRELAIAFAFTLGGILVLTLPAITAIAVHKLAGVEVKLVLLYIPLIEAGLFPYILPLAFLLAVVTTYGRLVADNEWTAIRMSGRNPRDCLLPGLCMALALGGLTLWLVSSKLPDIRARQSEYMTNALAGTLRQNNPGRTELQLQDFYISSASREGNDFIDAYVFVPGDKEGKKAKTILADRVRFNFDENNIYAELTNARTFQDGAFAKSGSATVRIELDALRKKPNKNTGVRYLKSSEMRDMIDRGELEEKADVFRYEVQSRQAMASTCIMFLLLGASTALHLKRGTQLMALAVAVGYVLLYYLLSMRVGMLLAHAHVVSPGVAAWAVAALGTVAGVYLTFRALRE
jgi:lipopolysaccharide export LptBFGC system permease protein LptF